ncbi:hypothetical protein RhiLY_12672 [Ceratobasidium sp. AG-Ba]|nr:hypothetical protein RhiLY_12672 [Ceratobasidium sp. AG-Ba]
MLPTQLELEPASVTLPMDIELNVIGTDASVSSSAIEDMFYGTPRIPGPALSVAHLNIEETQITVQEHIISAGHHLLEYQVQSDNYQDTTVDSSAVVNLDDDMHLDTGCQEIHAQEEPNPQEMSSNQEAHNVSEEIASAILDALGEALGTTSEFNTTSCLDENIPLVDLDGLITISPRTTPVPLPTPSLLTKRARSDSEGSNAKPKEDMNPNKKLRIHNESSSTISALGGLAHTSAHSTMPEASAQAATRPKHSGKQVPLGQFTTDRLDPDDEDALSNFSLEDWDLENVGDVFKDEKVYLTYCHVVND